jgi:phosphocarrier protein HPr
MPEGGRRVNAAPPDGENTPGLASATQLKRTVTIVNRRASIEVLRDGQSVSARSIMGLMMLGAGLGSTIELQADGWDAKEALDALCGLVEAGFNEQD